MIKVLKRFFLYLLLIVSPHFGQSSFSDLNLEITQISVEDGLSQSSIKCMLQDKKGYLWFGTANGLNRYDGYTFNVFTNDILDSNSISDNGALSLCEDADQNIWIGTVGGTLNMYERKSGRFIKYNLVQSLISPSDAEENYFNMPLPFSRNNQNSISSLAVDKNGFLWIGTWGKGLIKFNPIDGSTVHFLFQKNHASGIKSNRIEAVLVDSSNIVWVATIGGGLHRIIQKEKSNVIVAYNKGSANNISDDRVVSLCLDRNQNLWIGTFGGGLNLLSKIQQNIEPEKALFIKYKADGGNKKSIAGNFVLSIACDIQNNLWIGSYGDGLSLYNQINQKFETFKNNPDDPNSIVKNDILTVFVDRSGIIWLGTNLGKGVNKIKPKTSKFRNVQKRTTTKKGLNDDVVWSIHEDNKSIIWVGTYQGGLNRFDRSRNIFTYYKNDPADNSTISDNHIRAIASDSYGNLWLGTYSGGLNRFNSNSGKAVRFMHDNNIPNSIGANQVQSILIDNSEDFWIGTFGGGLNYFPGRESLLDKISFKKYLNDPANPFSISDNRVYCIYEDNSRILWIGTFGGGLNKFDIKSGQFISYKNIPGDESSIADNRVMAIYEDKDEFLWVGTYGGGLSKFDKKKEKFIRYNQKNQINSSVVYGILEDNFNQIWMSTDNGLCKFLKANQQFTQYDLNDGVQNLEFSGGAYFKSISGEFFFGGINGLNFFHPDSVIDNPFVPPIVISSIRVFNESLKGEPDSLVLPYDKNVFSIEFSALDYLIPRDNRYAYILQGFDKEWHFVDSRRRIANYTNLSPGEYVFVVIGSNNDGIWNYEGTTIYIKILPPFYREWWFIILSGLIVIGIIYYIVSLRFRSLLTIEKLKSRLAADLHDNVGSGLTEISILSEIASTTIVSDIENSKKNISIISDRSRQLIDNMSDIVWMVNPKRDSFYHLILRLKDSYADLLHGRGISFKTSNLENLYNLKLPHDYKQNLFLIFKEGLNNSIKHSNCKKITLDASIENNLLLISLKDDGIGIDKSHFESGNGILNMRSRAKVIGGNLQIISTSAGTEIKFSGNIKRTSIFNFLYE